MYSFDIPGLRIVETRPLILASGQDIVLKLIVCVCVPPLHPLYKEDNNGFQRHNTQRYIYTCIYTYIVCIYIYECIYYIYI